MIIVSALTLFLKVTGSLPDEFGGLTQLTSLAAHENYLTGSIPPLPSSLTGCRLGTFTWYTVLVCRKFACLKANTYACITVPHLFVAAAEDANWVHYTARKTEGNCFTDTTNAMFCTLSANCR